MTDRDIKPGQIWRHFKGNTYEIVTTAMWEPNPDQVIVIYRSIKNPNEVWARMAHEFLCCSIYIGEHVGFRFELLEGEP